QLRVQCVVRQPQLVSGDMSGIVLTTECLHLSVSGVEAVVSSCNNGKTEDLVAPLSTLLTTGSQRSHDASGCLVTPFPSGSLLMSGHTHTLHAALHNSTCVVVARNVHTFAVYGETLLWVDSLGTVYNTCLAQLRGHRQLVTADPS
ncbi:hypothetical protein KIPB_016910, partial [Kipferlia bialata]